LEQLEDRTLLSSPPTGVTGRVLETGQWWAGESNGSSAFSTSLWATWNPKVTWVDVQVGDFNGDSKLDIVGRVKETGQWWIGLSNGSAFTASLWGTWNPNVTWVDVQVGDFNGDGKADIVGRVQETGQWWVAQSTGSSFSNSLWSTWNPKATWVDVKIGDFNGDGMADITGRYLQGGSWWTALSTGSSFITSLWANWNNKVTWVDVQVGDFNGDGKPDIVGRVKETGQWWVGQSNGSAFTAHFWATWNPNVTWVDVQVGDLNADGKTDITGRVKETGQWWAGLSTGSSFTDSLWATWNPKVTWVDVQMEDLNTDGKADIVGRVKKTGQWWAGLSNSSAFTASLWATWNPNVTWVDVVNLGLSKKLDNVAPTITISSPVSGLITNTNVTIMGLVTDDRSGVASLQAAVDAGSFTAISFDASGNFSFATALALNGSADGNHTVHLQATDKAGNVTASNFSFSLDSVPPSITITSPASGLTTNTNPTITGQVIDSLSGVSNLQAELDSGGFISVTLDSLGNFNYTTVLALDGSVDGPHMVHFRATDKSGNVSSLTNLSFTLDTGPHISILSPTPNIGTSTNITITGQATSALSGVASLQDALDSGTSALLAIDPQGNFSFTTFLALDGSADGKHVIQFIATDNAGIASAPIDFSFTLDTHPPQIVITSPTGTVTTKTNVTIIGQATDTLPGDGTLQAAVDAGPFVLVPLDSSGNFSFITALPLDGTADGTHHVLFRAADKAGKTFDADFSFTLLTKPPATPVFALDPTANTGTLDNPITTAGIATLIGHTDPNVSVTLVGTGLQTVTNNTGSFQFPNVSLMVGTNSLTAQASSAAGNSSFTLTITRQAATNQENAVLFWNQAVLNAIQDDATDPLVASRAMAMVQAAVFDAVSAIDGTPGYAIQLTAPTDASANAAVASAAHTVLSYLYPAQQATFDSLLTASLASIPDGQGKTDGLNLGQSAGNAIIALRANDGWNKFIDYTPGNGPGVWVPTPPMYMEALGPQWATLQPWVMTSPSQFRPAGPPALTSQEWADAFNEVKTVGSATSPMRTADETQIARFWADGMGSFTPPGHWNLIAHQIAQAEGDSLAEDARLFAELDVTLADAAIVAWDAKYTDNAWRPVTAIRNADSAGNPNVTADPNWIPLLISPNFPEYVSGHSTFSAAAAAILDAYFGSSVSFSTTSITLPGVSRSFTSFDQAAAEAGQSRIYAGIHFQFSNQDGQAAGRALAGYALSYFNIAQDTIPPIIALNSVLPSGAANHNFTLTGQITDNLSGVASLTVQFDQGNVTNVSFDSSGNFSITTSFPLDGTADGRHLLTFVARDYASNATAPVLFSFNLSTRAPVLTLTNPANGSILAGGATLAGTVTSPGAAIASFGYAFDGATSMPVSFDGSGNFSQALDLSKLGTGAHTLVVTAQDTAGNTTTTSLNVSLPAMIPFALASVTPQSGSTDVGVTFRPKIDFSRPVNPSTLNSTDFFATDPSGAKLPASIVTADDGSFAWLFFTNAMPGASTITVTVDGSAIKAADGSLLDAAGTGTTGSKLTIHFTTVSQADLPNTSLSGILADPGPDLKPGTFDDVRPGPDGVLGDADDVYLRPIEGVKVFILGQESQAVFTDSQGRFSFSSLPSGDVKLALEGNTPGVTVYDPARQQFVDPNSEGFYFPEMVMDLTIQPGVANTVMSSMGTFQQQTANATNLGVYLPRVQRSILQPMSITQPTTVGLTGSSAPNLTPQQQQELTMTVQPNSAVGTDGQMMINVQVGVSTVPPQLVMDMLPAGVLQHTFDITIQAPGVATFTTPAQLTFPNVFNAPPGTKLNLLSFDHTTGRLEIDGTATVSADGLTVMTDPGSGVTHPGWHGLTTPGSDDQGGPPPAPPPPCTNLPQGMTSAGNACICALDPGLQNLLDTINNAFGGDARITSGNDGHHGKPGTPPNQNHDPHYSNKAIDLSGVNPVTGKRYTTAELLAIATAIAGQTPVPAATLPNSYIALFSFNGVHYKLLVEDTKGNNTLADWPPPATCNSHIHIEITDGPFPGTEASPLPCDSNSSNAPTDPPSGPYFVRIVMGNGQILRTVTGRSGNFSFFLPPNQQGSITLYSLTTDSFWISEFFTGPSGVSTTLTNQAEGEWDRQFTLSPPQFYEPEPTSGFVPWIQDNSPDLDGDGLGTLAEEVIGTDPNKYSTAGTGISDLAAVQEGINPLNPNPFSTGVVSSLQLGGQAQKVVLQGSTLDPKGQTAYVATGSYGLAIADASEFTKPTVLSQLQLPGNATDVSVDPNLQIAAVADNSGGLQIIDVSDPMQPKVIQNIPVPTGLVQVADGVAYAAVGANLESFDLLTGENLQTLPLVGSNIIAMAREGTILYTLDSGNILRAVDISGFQMVARGSVTLPHGGGKLFVGNGIAYAGVQPFPLPGRGFVSGYETVNVSNPDSLQVLGSGVNVTLGGNAVVANGSGLVLTVGTDGNGGPAVDVLDGSDLTNVNNFLTRFALPTVPSDIAIGAGIAFVADGSSGLQVVNYVPFDTKGIPPTVNISAPGADVDPSTPGIQVVEGSTIQIHAEVQDDVQVRNVELLVNGQVVRNAVSLPFNLSFIAPNITGTSNTVSVQVRTTDTGGNSTVSNSLTLNLVVDTFPLRILSIDPFDGAVRREGLQTVDIRFSKALAASTVNAANFQVVDANNNAPAPLNAELRSNGRLVQLTFTPIGPGSYQLIINAPAITDHAGNPLGTANVVSHFSVVAATIAWINSPGGDWNNPGNWDLGRVPNATDNVLISVPGNVTITFSQGNTTIQSLLSETAFTLSGGTLTVTGTIQVNNTFTINGGTLASALVLRGKTGQSIDISGSGAAFNGVISNADIQWSAGTLGGNGLISTGTITLVGIVAKTLDGSLSNTGVLLDTGMATLTLAGGSTLNNIGGTATIVGNNWSFQGAKVKWGTITGTSGAQLIFDGNAQNLLQGVTLNIDLGLREAGDLVHIVNGLTLNGQAVLGDSTRMIFDATATGMQQLDGSGTVFLGAGRDFSAAQVNVEGTTTLTIAAGITVHGGFGRVGGSYKVAGTSTVINQGTIQADVSGRWLIVEPSVLSHTGTLAAHGGGTLYVNNLVNYSAGTLTGGTWEVFANSTLQLNIPGIVTNDASIILDGANSSFLRDDGTDALTGFNINDSHGTFTIRNGRNFTFSGAFTNNGNLTVGATSLLTSGGDYTQSSGITSLLNGTLTTSGIVNIQGGVLFGSGIINGNVNNAGQIDVGNQIGVLTIAGNYTQTAVGILNIDVSGTTPGTDFDQLVISGRATLDGTLNVNLVNGFTPSAGESFKIVEYGSITGTFATVTGFAFTVSYDPNDLVLHS
jgi:hypothetical protein